MGSLDGQVALVTGGGSGIGRAVVARFVKEGARVAVLDRAAERSAALRAQFGDKIACLAGDVGRLEDNRRAVAETLAAFGRLERPLAFLAAGFGGAAARRQPAADRARPR